MAGGTALCSLPPKIPVSGRREARCRGENTELRARSAEPLHRQWSLLALIVAIFAPKAATFAPRSGHMAAENDVGNLKISHVNGEEQRKNRDFQAQRADSAPQFDPNLPFRPTKTAFPALFFSCSGGNAGIQTFSEIKYRWEFIEATCILRQPSQSKAAKFGCLLIAS